MILDFKEKTGNNARHYKITLPLEVMNKTTTKFPQILIITEQGLIGM